MCHGTATDNTIKNGDTVVLDFGVITVIIVPI